MAGFRLAPKAARQRRNPWQRRRVLFGGPPNLSRTVDDGFTIIELDLANGTPYVSQRTYNKTVADGFTVADSAVGANPSAGTATGGLFFLFSQGTTGSAYTRSASDGFTVSDSAGRSLAPVATNSYSLVASDGFVVSDAASGSVVAAGAASTLVGVELLFTAVLDVELVFVGE